MSNNVQTIDLNLEALLTDAALDIYTLMDLAALHNVTQQAARELLELPDNQHRVAKIRKELNDAGKDIEKRASYSIANVVIPELVKASQQVDTTPDELVKIGTLLHKFTGVDRKSAEKTVQKQLPSINIFLGDDDKPTTLRVVNSEALKINSDIDDVPYTEEA